VLAENLRAFEAAELCTPLSLVELRSFPRSLELLSLTLGLADATRCNCHISSLSQMDHCASLLTEPTNTVEDIPRTWGSSSGSPKETQGTDRRDKHTLE
jgi:hypothetical protein